jgi:hypothetical protein
MNVCLDAEQEIEKAKIQQMMKELIQEPVK